VASGALNMMVLIDTSVWIDFFVGRSLPHVLALESLIQEREDICICGVVLTEVLQGIRENAEFRKTRDLLSTLIFLPTRYATFLKSSEMFRSLRRKGITIRKPVDCLIAAVAVGNDIPLLHNDKDFHPLERHCGLKAHMIEG
jgi:predicted nucleic acid-binding protein